MVELIQERRKKKSQEEQCTRPTGHRSRLDQKDGGTQVEKKSMSKEYVILDLKILNYHKGKQFQKWAFEILEKAF